MIKVFATGNLGKDAETKTVGEHKVTTFSIASNKKIKGEKVTTWVNCQIWNREKLAPYLQKGVNVSVAGDLEIREYEGKYYTTINVNDLSFGSQPAKPENTESDRATNAAENTAVVEESEEDDLPF